MRVVGPGGPPPLPRRKNQSESDYHEILAEYELSKKEKRVNIQILPPKFDEKEWANFHSLAQLGLIETAPTNRGGLPKIPKPANKIYVLGLTAKGEEFANLCQPDCRWDASIDTLIKSNALTFSNLLSELRRRAKMDIKEQIKKG